MEIITTNPDGVIENVPLTLSEDNITSVKHSAVDTAKESNSINISKTKTNNNNNNNIKLVDKVNDNYTLSGSKFFDVVETLTRSRSKYPKKTYYNVLYKFIANAGIGQMARGLNQKTSFDTKSGINIVTSAGPLINPLYGGWITSFIRTVLAEIMNNVHNQGGRIISCTTDGFISDMSGLDSMNIDGPNCEFARMYKEARFNLLQKEEALLEIKYVEKEGVIS